MILSPVIISLKVALVSTIIVFILGIALAFIFTRYNFKGKALLETLILLPMCLPPTVVGYGLLLFIGKNGLVGKITTSLFGNTLVFTWVGAAIGGAIVALPLMYQSTKAAFLDIDIAYIESAKSLGAKDGSIFYYIIMPLAIEGIISGVILSFTRALGEFGATLMVAGNIPGKTQTIPIAIYFAVESGNKLQANILMAIVVIFSFSVVFFLNRGIRLRR
ncbi:MAG: molybdate ABC transporter permease subunit [Clostridium sp.]|uniref:molybdate ABC transporter permease subunit n=1 Tax=Clostridium sp. TaxID=1506 RepID=UPI0030419041